MTGSVLLLHLLAGVALLLWAVRMVRTGVERAFGQRLQQVVRRATATAPQSLACGVLVSTALQSSTAAAALIAGFVQRATVAVPAGIAFMLGADIGSTLIVQALSFSQPLALPLLLVCGVGLFMMSQRSDAKQIGRIAIGLALMIVALGMIGKASDPLRESWLMRQVLAALSLDPVLTLIIGAALTWLLHSTVATILFVMSLAGAGVVPPQAAALLIIAANVGAGLIPLGLTWRSGTAVRRVMAGNLMARLAMGVTAASLLPAIMPWLDAVSGDPSRMLANLHTAFNVAQAAVALPLVAVIARLVAHIVPEAQGTLVPERPNHLDAALLAEPSVALANATRETMRLADSVEVMLRESLTAFADADGRRRTEIRALDDEVDRLQEEIKLYLTRLSGRPMADEEARRCFDLIMFTTNLEHVGDIVDRGLMALAAKKAKAGFAFSEEGWSEIVGLHQRALAQLRLALTVFQSRDPALARRLVAEKDRFRDAEAEAIRAHLQRLRDGAPASLATSTLHLDVLRDLKRIVSHLTSVALPILEAAGEIRGTRLRDTRSAETGG